MRVVWHDQVAGRLRVQIGFPLPPDLAGLIILEAHSSNCDQGEGIGLTYCAIAHHYLFHRSNERPLDFGNFLLGEL